MQNIDPFTFRGFRIPVLFRCVQETLEIILEGLSFAAA